MIDCKQIGILMLYSWPDGPRMHFRLSELKESSVEWLIGFLNGLHGQPAITEPELRF